MVLTTVMLKYIVVNLDFPDVSFQLIYDIADGRNFGRCEMTLCRCHHFHKMLFRSAIIILNLNPKSFNYASRPEICTVIFFSLKYKQNVTLPSKGSMYFCFQ